MNIILPTFDDTFRYGGWRRTFNAAAMRGNSPAYSHTARQRGLAMRMAMMGGKQKQVAYRVVEWIGFRGAQRIDTGLVNTGRSYTTTIFQGSMAWTSSSSGLVFAGVRTGSVDHAYFLCTYNGTIAYEWCGVKEFSTTKSIVVGEKIDFSTTLCSGFQKLVVDDVDVYSSTSSSYADASDTITVGCCHTNNVAYQYYGSFNLYGLKIFRGGTLVRDFVGAIDENGVYCIVDKLHYDSTGKQKAYYNEGSGSFSHGAETGEVLYYA